MSETSKYEHAVIYEIFNDVDDLKYIGSAIDMEKRFKRHKYDANRKPDIGLLYPHMNRIGIEHFHIRKIEDYPTTSNEALLLREKHWIEERKPKLNANQHVITDWEDINKRRKVIVDEYLKEDPEYVIRIEKAGSNVRCLYVRLLKKKVWSKLKASERKLFISLLDESSSKREQFLIDNPYPDPDNPHHDPALSNSRFEKIQMINKKLHALDGQYAIKIFKMTRDLISKYSLEQEERGKCCDNISNDDLMTYLQESSQYYETEYKLLYDNANEREKCKYCDITLSSSSRPNHCNTNKHVLNMYRAYVEKKITDKVQIDWILSQKKLYDRKQANLQEKRKERKKLRERRE